MKSNIIALSLLLSLTAVAGSANAKGCLKGAAVGGVGGHVAGKHGVIGAAAGCGVGHHMANKKAKQQKNAQATTTTQATTSPTTVTPAPANK